MARLLSWLLALAALPVSASPAPAGDDVGEHLADLGSPVAYERLRAERWLALHLAREDYPLLVQTARRADAEVLRRLARAAASADRSITLGMLFFAEREPVLAELGEEILRQRMARWNPKIGQPGLTGQALRNALVMRARRAGAPPIEVDLLAPLYESCDLVGRLGGLPLGLTLDVGVTPGALEAEGRTQPFVGPWPDIALGLASAHHVALEGFGLPESGEDPAKIGSGFLRFGPVSGAGASTGADVLLAWCAVLAREDGRFRRSAAAVNLAASGWTGLLSWLEESYASSGDEAALAGLLAAAARGRVSFVLARPDTVRALVDRASLDLERGTPDGRRRAHRVLDGLGPVGCLGTRGEDLSLVVFEGWERASARSRWLRLAIGEAFACGDATRRRAREVLLDDVAAPALWEQALRTWAALHPDASDGLELAEPGRILGRAENAREARELAARLVQGQVRPPSGWPALEAEVGMSPVARLGALMWWLASEAEGDAGAYVSALSSALPGDAASRGELLAEALRFRVRRGDLGACAALGAARAAARDRTAALELGRVELLTGCLEPARAAELLEALAEAPIATPDLALLGAAAGLEELPAARAARDELLAQLERALADDRSAADAAPLLAALERALDALFGSGRDDLARELNSDVTRRLNTHRRGELARELARRRWPPPPQRRVRILAELPRRLEAGEL